VKEKINWLRVFCIFITISLVCGMQINIVNGYEYPAAVDFQYPLGDGSKEIFVGYGTALDFGDCRESGRFTGYHLARDVSAPTGTKLYAIANGKVVVSDNQSFGGYGNCGGRGYIVIIEHNGSEISLYGHVQQGEYNKEEETGLIQNGTVVEKGQYIATVADYWQDLNGNKICGDDGDQNWDHVHFGIRKGAFDSTKLDRFVKGYSIYNRNSETNDLIWFEDIDEKIGEVCAGEKNLGGEWTNPITFIDEHMSPQNKSLVKIQGQDAIYWLQNGKAYHVLNFEAIDNMAGIPGWDRNQIRTYSSDKLIIVPKGEKGGFEESSDFISTNSSSNDLLIKLTTDPKVYRMEDGKRNR